MAEYEGKADSEICATCKYFHPIIGKKVRTSERENTLAGWCKKRPRLAQKHDDKTNATNWCQYYEANMDKKKLLEDAIEMITPSPDAPLTLTSEEREALDKELRDKYMDDPMQDKAGEGRTRYEDGEEVASTASPSDWINDPTVAAHVVNENVRQELATLLKELTQFQQNTERQLVNVTLNGDNLAIMETKGMLRVTALLRTQIEGRIAELTQAAESYGAARPHRGEVN